ncbi:MAG TPA: leucyl aminopeptidase [Vicinamibacterales bacterium]|nr:leucyl aminopeptidase [Vicinamibacterales bacterium]
MPSIRLLTDPAPAVDTDLLVVPVFDGEDAADALPAVDAASHGEVHRATASGEIRGRLYEFFVTPTAGDKWKPRLIGIAGAGKAADFDTERLRKLATASALMARGRRIPRVAFLHRGVIPGADAAQAIVEGLILAAFSVDQYKTGERFGPPADDLAVVITVDGGSRASIERAIQRGRVLGESSNLARALANEPPNVLTPQVFAERAGTIARDAGVAVEILDEKAIQRLGMGLLLGVARGSAEPPRVIVLRHEPPGAPTAPVLGLVGKGITFDTGGISIKPAEGMDRMKDDMAGGAAVICAMRAISLLEAPIRVIGVVPTTENMPGGRALRPGDILTGASGKTVEVINTDAEGRLILGDGLWYALHLGATHLVDVATLTGACVVGLGKAMSGLFGRPDSWRNLVQEVALKAGDRSWPMPLYDEYLEQMRSEIADLVNSGGRAGGACTAAAFLKEFAGSVPWVHLDIAGTAWAEEAKPYQPKGPIGVAVRTLAELAFTADRW